MIRWVLYVMAGAAIVTASALTAIVWLGWHHWKGRIHG